MARGGKREGAGRPQGSLDKNNKELREMILAALEQKGGVEYLAARAESHPQAFMALLGRVLPMTVAGDPDNPLKASLTVSFVKPDPVP